MLAPQVAQNLDSSGFAASQLEHTLTGKGYPGESGTSGPIGSNQVIELAEGERDGIHSCAG